MNAKPTIVSPKAIKTAIAAAAVLFAAAALVILATAASPERGTRAPASGAASSEPGPLAR